MPRLILCINLTGVEGAQTAEQASRHVSGRVCLGEISFCMPWPRRAEPPHRRSGHQPVCGGSIGQKGKGRAKVLPAGAETPVFCPWTLLPRSEMMAGWSSQRMVLKDRVHLHALFSPSIQVIFLLFSFSPLLSFYI